MRAMRLRHRSCLPLALLLIALLPGGVSGADDRDTAVSAEQAKPAAESRSKAEVDGRASPNPDDLLVDEGPPPGTCPVTEEIVETYCKDHPDDAGCRAHRGQ